MAKGLTWSSWWASLPHSKGEMGFAGCLALLCSLAFILLLSGKCWEWSRWSEYLGPANPGTKRLIICNIFFSNTEHFSASSASLILSFPQIEKTCPMVLLHDHNLLRQWSYFASGDLFSTPHPTPPPPIGNNVVIVPTVRNGLVLLSYKYFSISPPRTRAWKLAQFGDFLQGTQAETHG